jgi:para-aminobenzoate synthetase component I
MKLADLSPDQFLPVLLASARETGLCLLDSCNAGHPGSDKLIAGIEPARTTAMAGDIGSTLAALDQLLTGERPVVFTISYEFGRKLQLGDRVSADRSTEPDLFAAEFDGLLIHDYAISKTVLHGNAARFEKLFETRSVSASGEQIRGDCVARSNFSKSEYISAIGHIKQLIRDGDTYQTNLTQQLSVDLGDQFSAADAFARLRRRNPAPFAAYIERSGSTVISASPERFFMVNGRDILASPIKGTRRRGSDALEDECLRGELLQSEKDRAENVMIADLLRNDLGRVCEYGSVEVTELCALQELPTVFHLVSTVKGTLQNGAAPSDIVRSMFPCGSITGAPKIRTMQIIDRLEPAPRGLSMGSIGVYVPGGAFAAESHLDLSVAIRTMVIRDRQAVFNVGGGVTIDSDAADEYDESLATARVLLDSLGCQPPI